MMYIESLFFWVVRASIEASVIGGCILAVQWLLRRRLNARWQYALWLILIVRLVMPWTPESRTSVYNALPRFQHENAGSVTAGNEVSDIGFRVSGFGNPEPRTSTLSEIANAQPVQQAEETPTRPFSETQLRPLSLLAVLWLAGVLFLAAHLLVQNVRFWVYIRKERPEQGPEITALFARCKGLTAVRGAIPLIATEAVTSPALFGLWRPRLLLPVKMVEIGDLTALRYVFLHELAHIKRQDILVNWLATLLQVLHWFNPVMWYAFYRVRMDREPACDALALSYVNPDESREYGQTIISLLEQVYQVRRIPGMAGILEDKSQLKRRISMIALFSRNSYRWSALAATVLLLLSAGLLTKAKVTAQTAPPPASAPLSEAKSPEPGKWAAKFSNGRSVELIAVRKHNNPDKSFWQPDGTPRAEPPYDHPKQENIAATGTSYEFVVTERKGSDDGLDSIRVDWTGGGIGSSQALAKDETPIPDLSTYVVFVQPKTEHPTLEFRVPSDNWKTLTTWEADGRGSESSERGLVAYAGAYEKDGAVYVTVTISGEISNKFSRLFALDSAGTARPANELTANGGENVYQKTYGFTGLKLDNVKKFRLETCGSEAARFTDISLAPGQHTDCKVTVGKESPAEAQKKPVASPVTQTEAHNGDSTADVAQLETRYYELGNVQNAREVADLLEKAIPFVSAVGHGKISSFEYIPEKKQIVAKNIPKNLELLEQLLVRLDVRGPEIAPAQKKLDPAQVRELNAKGEELLKTGKYAEATNVYNQLLQGAPEDNTSLLNKAENLFKNKKYPEAVEAYREIYKKYPKWDYAGHALMMEGICYDNMDKKDEALKTLEKAVHEYPDIKGFSEAIWLHYGEICLAAGKKAEALDALKQYVALCDSSGKFKRPQALDQIVQLERETQPGPVGYLGVMLSEVGDKAESLGLSDEKGAQVRGIGPNAPAAKADIKPGDVIRKINGQIVEDMRDCVKQISALPPSTKVTLDIWRDKAPKQIEVVLGNIETDSPSQHNYTHKVTFAPAGDFHPQTPKELLDVFNGVCKASTGYFRTQPEDGRLVGTICTDNPEALRTQLEGEPRLKWVEAIPLTPKMFEELSARKQESLNPYRRHDVEGLFSQLADTVGSFGPLNKLIDMAKGDHGEVRAQIKKRATQILEDFSLNHAQRWQCCYILSGIGDEDAIPELAKILKQGDTGTIRGVAACALGKYDIPAAKKALEEALPLEKSPDVAQWIRRSLNGEFLHDKKGTVSAGSGATPEGRYTHLVTFEPAGDFKPQTPWALLDVFNGVCEVRTGYFRTKPQDGKLEGSICTDDPDTLRKQLEGEPRLKWVEAVPLTPRMFTEHAARKQESLNQDQGPDIEGLFNQLASTLGSFGPLNELINMAKADHGEVRAHVKKRAAQILGDLSLNHAQRWQCCYVLSGIGDEDSIPVLVKVLRDGDTETIRGVAACAVGKYDTPAAKQALEQALPLEKSPDVAQWIRRSLNGEFRDKKAPGPV